MLRQLIHGRKSTQTRHKQMIHIIRARATKEQLEEMLQTLGSYIKLAVDIERNILAGGGDLHADCEAALLENGSEQKNICGG